MAELKNKESARRVGRRIGILLLVQAILAIPVFTEVGMLRSIIVAGFLENAAGSAVQIRVALLLLFVLGALTLVVAIEGLPLFRRYAERMALAFLALSILGMALEGTETHAIRTMLSTSLQYAKPDAPKEILQVVASTARSTWSSAHFTNLMLGHLKLFVLYVILFRSALVPRALAGFGIAASILSMTAAIRALLGYRFLYALIAPAGLCLIFLSIWLVIRGFAEREPVEGTLDQSSHRIG